jgi:hypothetical protein
MAAVGSMGAGSDATHALFTWELIYVIGVFVNLAVGISAIVAAWAGLRARKDTQKREIVFGDQYVTRTEAQNHQVEIERRITRVETAISSMEERGRTSMDSFESAMDLKVTRIHERLDGVESKISSVPHQIVALLVNTRQLNAPLHNEQSH